MARTMDDIASDLLTGSDDVSLHDVAEREENSPAESVADAAKKSRSLRRGIFRAANLQDKILEKVISQMIPIDAAPPDTSAPDDAPLYPERPGFSIPAMSNNFRRFNARIGVVFKFQARVIRLLSWRRPSHTLSLLAVYTFICLNPYLLCVLPLAIAIFGILVPSFVARHPAPSGPAAPADVRTLGYSPRGPPLAPARTVRPVKELSRDFFRNMGDLQNSMEDFSVAHDQVIALVVPATNFSDEALSSAILVLLFAAAAFMSIAAHLLPWRFIALAGGWAAIISGHPAVVRLMRRTQKQYMTGGSPAGKGQPSATVVPPIPSKNALAAAFEDWVRSDIILDEAPETREVEIFELQRRGDDTGGEWEPWLFSPSPYDPLSAARLAGERPSGTRFFEDVLPPDGGWEWSEKKWALDLWSREWVEERIITGVEVETEGERWVYDMFNENEMHTGVRDDDGDTMPAGFGPGLSWEESEEGIGRRGEWRRRRWVRMVKRKNVTATS